MPRAGEGGGGAGHPPRRPRRSAAPRISPLDTPLHLSKPNYKGTANFISARVETSEEPAAAAGGGRDTAPPRLDTGAVFGSGREVILVHRGQEYRLRITKAGKLILTK
jgi:hemin uptake protein HemP